MDALLAENERIKKDVREWWKMTTFLSDLALGSNSLPAKLRAIALILGNKCTKLKL